MPKDDGHQKRDLRKMLAGSIDAAIKAQHGEYAWEDIVSKLVAQHNDPAMKEALWSDTIRAIVHENLHQRSQININPDLSLWLSRDLEEGVIIIGEGLAVSYRDAQLPHWKQKVINQQKVIDSTTIRRDAVLEVIAQLEADMSARPELTTGQWMKERGYPKDN